MKNCTKDCIEYISSSCVEYTISESVFDKLVFIEEELVKINKFFTNTIDGKTLGTGTDLLFTVQKLIDKAIVLPVIAKTPSLDVDLNALELPQNSIVNQEQLNKILINQISTLKAQLKLININNNY